MRRLVVVPLTLAALVAVAWGPALAWQCPVHINAAEDAIKKADAMNMPPEAKALVAEARRLVAEAKKHHKEGSAKIDHANAMWKARAALAQAEAAATISTP